jgi:regulator of RNase E activity RraA
MPTGDSMRDGSLLVAAVEELYAPVLSDVLDAAGCRDHAMRPGIRPLDDNLVLCGHARTAQYVDGEQSEPEQNPYQLTMTLVDDLKVGEVVVLACGGSIRIAPWGELLSTAAQARGAAGFVTDGLVRDSRTVRKMKFPVFHAGIGLIDAKGRGRVAAIDIPVECGGVLVRPGDLVFGDADGVVVIPKEDEESILRAAMARVAAEDRMRRELRQGKTLIEVFAKYRVL